MEIILILIPLSAIVVIGAIAAFFWAVDAGQFEDVDRQGRKSLFGDATAPKKSKEKSVHSQSWSS